jgi:hypothetical protein
MGDTITCAVCEAELVGNRRFLRHAWAEHRLRAMAVATFLLAWAAMMALLVWTFVRMSR